MTDAPTAVLVVDDDPDHAQIASLMLHALAPELPVMVCGDSAAAVIALDELPRGSLVVVDRLLGGVESFDAIAQMHGVRPDVTIVMVSAVLTHLDRAAALAYGAREAFEKPSSLAGWRVMLGALLGLPGAADAEPSPAA